MFRQLRYFQSVVRLNSFSAAAEENYISQSAISQQIQALERELGFRLIQRKNRSFTLTPAGEYFYQKSLILTADYERMCSEAARLAMGDQAALKIGYLRCYTGGEFLYAENLEEARQMVIGRKGFFPVEGGGPVLVMGTSIAHVPLLAALLEVWEASVRATHLFLSDAEVRRIKECVPTALGAVAHLVVAEERPQRPVSFMEIENGRLEMLFLAPTERGRGMADS